MSLQEQGTSREGCYGLWSGSFDTHSHPKLPEGLGHDYRCGMEEAIKGAVQSSLGIRDSGKGKEGWLAVLTVDMLCAEIKKNIQTPGRAGVLLCEFPALCQVCTDGAAAPACVHLCVCTG